MRKLLSVLFLLLASPAFGQGFTGPTSGYPQGSQPLAVAATGTTGAVTATLPAASNQITYICGFSVSFIETATGATTSGPVTVTNLNAGAITFTYQIAAVAASQAFTFSQTFTPCLLGNGAGGTVNVVTTANAQAAAVDVQAWGYRQ